MSLNKNFFIFLLSLLLLAGIFTRFNGLGTYITQYDDVFTCIDIIKAKSNNFQKEVMTKAYDQNKETYNEFPKNFFRRLDQNPSLSWLLTAGFKAAPFIIIPINSTNAPVHYILSVLLLNGEQSYEQALFWGRFPAFIYSVLSLFFLVWLLKLIFIEQKKYQIAVLTGLTIFSFSLMNIIYAQQTYAYSIGVTSLILLIILLVKIINGSYLLKGRKNLLCLSFLLAFLTYTHYQILFFIPSFFLAVFLVFFKKDREIIHKIIVSGLVYLLMILPALYMSLFVNPNAGTGTFYHGYNNQFLFDYSNYKYLFSKISYFFTFFIKNFYISLQNNLTPVVSGSLFFDFWGVFFILSLSAGLVYLFKQRKQAQEKGLLIFICSSAVIWLIMILAQKMTLSPTRHALINTPIMLLLVSYGTVYLAKKIKHLPSLIIILLILSFTINYPDFYKTRRDPVKEKEIAGLLKKYQPTLVLGYEQGFNLRLMPSVIKQYNYYDRENTVVNLPWSYKKILLFSNKHPLNKKTFNNLKDQLNNEKLVPIKIPYILKDYKIIYQQEKPSKLHTEISPLIPKDKTDGQYLYILELK